MNEKKGNEKKGDVMDLGFDHRDPKDREPLFGLSWKVKWADLYSAPIHHPNDLASITIVKDHKGRGFAMKTQKPD